MLFGRKKTSAIDRRLEELQREMAKIGTELKSVARHAKQGGEAPVSAPGAGQASNAPAVPAAGREPPAPVCAPIDPARSMGADKTVASAPGMDKPASISALPAGESAGDLPLFEQRSPLSMTGREKFANYFMAGHFSNLRPLRQEKRIIRKKAIIWIILVVLALLWVLFFPNYR
jgi:hypothetical protein